MSTPPTVKVSIEQLAKNAYEFRTVMRGRFYSRQYIGYAKKDALSRFSTWLYKQNNDKA